MGPLDSAADGARSAYQRGEAAGQRKLLALQLRTRLGESAETLVARIRLADEALVGHAGGLLAEKLSDEELRAKLEEVLPRTQADEEEDAE